MALPIKIGDLLKFGKTLLKAQKQGLRLTIYVDPRADLGLVSEVCELLRPETKRSQVFVQVLSGQAGDDAALIVHDRKTVARIVLCSCAADVACLAPFPAPTCVIAADEIRSVVAQRLGLSILDTASPLSGDLHKQLATWLSMTLSQRRLTLAGDFSFTRAVVGGDLCSATAWQNAVIALAPLTHGADLPVLMGNQIKMVFQLALADGLKLNAQRVPELAATGAVALIGRRISRRLAFRFAPARWLARGVIAFALTLAWGQAARLYYDRRALDAAARTAALGADDADTDTDAPTRFLEAVIQANPTETLRGLLQSAPASRG